MKTAIIIVAMILLFPAIISAEWTKYDTYREITWGVIHIADWGQTLDIARNPDKYHEYNPVLGNHPSIGKVNLYMGLSTITHAGVSMLLPKKYRAYWQYFSIGVSGLCVINNFHAGLKVKF